MSDTSQKRMISIGKRLKLARDVFGYTQEYVSDKLGISRQRYCDIENGKRSIPLKELYKFADFYNKSIDYFLRKEEDSKSGFNVLCRKMGGDSKITNVITEFEELCEKMHDIEKIMGMSFKPHQENDYQYEQDRPLYWAEHYALEERKRLDLGLAPVKALDQILEEKCGIKIFYLSIPDGSNIYGMFAYNNDIGGCILVNKDANEGNQLFSIAHEYAHYLFHKSRLGIISSKSERKTLHERIANCFAANFLMPKAAVESIVDYRVKNRKEITQEDVVYIADYFGVSFTTMVYRLNNLNILNSTKREKFIAETWVMKVRESLGLQIQTKERDKFPGLYRHLCIKAYKEEKITTLKFADFMDIPMDKAMEIGRSIRRKVNSENI